MASVKSHVDVAFWGGVVPGNTGELLAMVAEGVVGFKCFLCPSGVPEFPHVEESDVELALQTLSGTNAVLAVGSGIWAVEECLDAKINTLVFFLGSSMPRSARITIRCRTRANRKSTRAI